MTLRRRVLLAERAQRVTSSVQTMLWAVVDGLTLGALDDEDFDELDRRAYERDQRYVDRTYLERGLFEWERRFVERIAPGIRVLVLAAGAGREAAALHRAGLVVDAFEPNDRLREQGNAWLEGIGLPVRIMPVGRDEVPAAEPGVRPLHAAILGWGLYSLVNPAPARIRLLRALASRLAPGGLVLVSFLVVEDWSRSDRVRTGIARIVRWARCARTKGGVELGEVVQPNRMRRFRLAEARDEVTQAGLVVVESGDRPYGWLVARRP
jgi:hypothetical protein